MLWYRLKPEGPERGSSQVPWQVAVTGMGKYRAPTRRKEIQPT